MMRSALLRTALLGGSVALTGIRCGAAPEESEGPRFANAYALPDCAPWDGSAVSIYLTNATYDSVDEHVEEPFLHLAIWKSVRGAGETTISWPGEESVGGAYHCVMADQCSAATSGRVSVSGMAGDSILPGEYDLRFADSTVMRGRFRARWIDRRMLCG